MRFPDAGCGPGAKLGFRGVDGALPGAPFADGSFDLIGPFHLIKYVGRDASAVTDLAGVLATGRHLIFTIPAHPWLWRGHSLRNKHFRRNRARKIRAKLAAAEKPPCSAHAAARRLGVDQAAGRPRRHGGRERPVHA